MSELDKDLKLIHNNDWKNVKNNHKKWLKKYNSLLKQNKYKEAFHLKVYC